MNFFRVSARHFHSLKAATKEPLKIRTKEDVQEYMKVFPQIMRDLTESDEFSDIPQANKWLARVLDYNVPHGNNSKTMTVPLSYKSLEDPDKFTPETQKLSNILGWCLELNQVSLLIQDDILDAGVTRRNKPSWYKLEDVGMRAVNDALLLEVGVFKILKKYFSQDPSYVKYMERFREITYNCGMAQTFDGVIIKEGKANINAYAMDRYEKIVKYKSEPYSFVCPTVIAMHLAKKFDPVDYEQVKPVLEQLGWILQVNNDFTDVYGESGYTGCEGTDIKNGTCSWVICTAVERANESQKRVLQANYGKDHPDAIQAVKQIFDDLDMKGLYEDHETRKLEEVRNRIAHIYEKYPHKTFLELLNDYSTQSNWKDIEWWRS